MPTTGRLFANDEELGKKDDEYRPGANGKLPAATWKSQWKIASPRMRKRRLAITFLVSLCVYLFIKNMPTNLTPVGERVDIRVPGRTVRGDAVHSNYAPNSHGKEFPTGPPQMGEGAKAPKTTQHYFNGPIKWYHLAPTLQGAARAMGYKMFDKNVVFVAAEAHSIARLLPVACEMARWNRNVVHLVLLGRDDLTIEEYKEINGVDDTCKIYWHDARPDYAPYSADERFELNTYQSLVHVHNFLHPQVYIMDEPSREEVPFVRGLQGNARRFGTTIIRLPTNAVERLRWLTRLDSGSLAAWHNTYVEILIHAPSESSGSFIRLLKSIQNADYFGTRYPHLTIELPHDLDKPTEDFLANFIWPPLPSDDSPHTSQLTLRRRIPSSRLSATEASVRMVESFYPSRVRDSHVLLLSHQAELSSLYYHYLMYNLLEYKYSLYGEGTRETEQLMGISLTLPSRLLDDQTKLTTPKAFFDEQYVAEFGEYTPFLWQAPEAHATLYFGDKWREFHSFLSLRLSKASIALPKNVASSFPAFVEHLLEIMRIRNYVILYPHLNNHAIATVHNELYQMPEEFRSEEDENNETTDEETSLADTDEPFLKPIAPPPHPKSHEEHLARTPLHKLLPAEGDLPELSTLPLLSYLGRQVRPSAAIKEAKFFTETFRANVGLCPQNYAPTVEVLSARDLFCYGEDEDYMSSVVDDTAGSRDGTSSVGFGSGRGRDNAEGSYTGPVDEYGDPLEPPVSEEKRAKMSREFEMHLERQSKQGIRTGASAASNGKHSPKGPPPKDKSDFKAKLKDLEKQQPEGEAEQSREDEAKGGSETKRRGATNTDAPEQSEAATKKSGNETVAKGSGENS